PEGSPTGCTLSTQTRINILSIPVTPAYSALVSTGQHYLELPNNTYTFRLPWKAGGSGCQGYLPFMASLPQSESAIRSEESAWTRGLRHLHVGSAKYRKCLVLVTSKRAG